MPSAGSEFPFYLGPSNLLSMEVKVGGLIVTAYLDTGGSHAFLEFGAYEALAKINERVRQTRSARDRAQAGPVCERHLAAGRGGPGDRDESRAAPAKRRNSCGEGTTYTTSGRRLGTWQPLGSASITSADWSSPTPDRTGTEYTNRGKWREQFVSAQPLVSSKFSNSKFKN